MTFPDGEVLSVPGSYNLGRADWSTTVNQSVAQPYASASQIRDYLTLNWLERPPLTVEEIQLMPVQEVIALYYSCRYQPKPGTYRPNSTVVKGLGIGRLAWDHEEHIQERIYVTRPELHYTTYNSRTFRILLPPSEFKIIESPPDLLGTVTQAVVLGILGAGVGALGVVASVGVQVAQAGAAAYQQKQIQDAINKATNITGELQAGVTIAKSLFHDPVPDQSTITTLKTNLDHWNTVVAQAKQIAPQVIKYGSHLHDASYVLVIEQGSSAYSWAPFNRFFYSLSVQQMVLSSGKQSISQQVQQPISGRSAAIGLGIGALLLLL